MISTLAKTTATAALLVCVTVTHAAPVETSTPTVTEVFEPDGFPPFLEYTISNPEPSTIGHVVGLMVEIPDEVVTTDTDNGWGYYLINSSMWHMEMDSLGDVGPGPETLLTWAEFFNREVYPFDESTRAATFFVPYSFEDGAITSDSSDPDALFLFDFELAIAPGSNLDGFFSLFAERPASEYIVAGIDANNPFGPNSLNTLVGNTIPTPGAMVAGIPLLFGITLTAKYRHAKRHA